MGQLKSKHVYNNVESGGDESPSGPETLNRMSYPGEQAPGVEGSNADRRKNSHPLRDLSFKRHSASSAASSTTTLSDDSLRAESEECVLRPLYKKAVGYYLARARAGDPFASYYVGLAHERGFAEHTRDAGEAAKWYKRSADAGSVIAEHALQRLSADTDMAQRAELLLRAAVQGHRQAAVRLRALCRRHPPVAEQLAARRERLAACDDAQSLGALAFLTAFLDPTGGECDAVLDMLTRAADHGDRDAACALGRLYLRGAGKKHAPRDDLASRYLTLAADRGQLLAQIELGKYHEGVAGCHVGGEDHEAKAYRYYGMAADQGSAEGWLNVGHQYLYGAVVEYDVAMAIDCLERAAVTVDYAECGRSNRRALCALGRIYRYGIADAVATDYGRALAMFTLAAERDSPHARLELGKMYARGVGVERDVQRASALLESVPSLPEGRYQLARACRAEDPRAAECHYHEALRGYTRDLAAHRDYTVGLYRVGKMHELGLGTSRDVMKAKAFYYRATTSADRTYIMWWRSYGDKAYRRLGNLQQPTENGIAATPD